MLFENVSFLSSNAEILWKQLLEKKTTDVQDLWR